MLRAINRWVDREKSILTKEGRGAKLGEVENKNGLGKMQVPVHYLSRSIPSPALVKNG
jgi:hypothetical protein